MKLSQLTESFVISNDEFEDYLNRTTEQLAQELQSGKNARDAIHDLALQFSAQHNKAYEAYVRMSDALTARMHTLELDAPAAPAAPEMGMEPEMGAPEMGDDMGGEPEMMTDPMGDMEMDTPADDEMPSDSDMDDYNAVMDNEPEAEEMGESVVNEASCGCCGNDPCDCDDSCDCKKVDESGILYKAGVKKYGKEGMKKIQSASGKGASAEEIGKIKDQHRKKKTEAVVEGDDKPYICVHAKKGKHECHAGSSYEAAKKAAAHWKMKSTAGIDAHLAVDEGIKDTVNAAGKKIGKATKKAKEFFGHGEHPAFDEFDESVSESAMDTINQIVADKQAGKLHGMTVDMFTASAIKQIYDAVNDNNKAKLDDLMSSKEGVLKAANMAMKMMKEGKMNEFAPIAAVAGGLARGVGAAAGAASRVASTAAKVAGNKKLKTAVKVGKALGKMGRAAYDAGETQFNRAAESTADDIMRSSTRASFSEYNEFYKELDNAAKAGKKAGDTIKVGGKNIKLKSDPKQMHQLSDSDMDAIDALAQRLNEKGCSSKYKK